ncbi:hypothetical protein FNV43_RR08303 [Rhamnella rubrinervis]|uniref:Uncharacterized protein n=1 Tax=Rhamnella rubrinervis TaxID=2594499 RepID=A0A8K0HI78_9ROSA|nr:hypothetical protein FNV43_RR08303 [Rhamnella rubrinervis]
MSLESLSSTSSTRSDAESAPPDFEGILDRISKEYTEWVGRSGRQLPPEWTMPDLVRAVIADERIEIPGFLRDDYYDEGVSFCPVWGIIFLNQECLNWINSLILHNSSGHAFSSLLSIFPYAMMEMEYLGSAEF